MNAKALLHGFLSRVTFQAKPVPGPEPINGKPRQMNGLWAGLSAGQKAKALAYDGPENHGNLKDADFRLRR